jgi:DNA polymerase III delta prime subunit
MHAYLFVGREEESIDTEMAKRAKKLGARILEYSFAKIDEVRNLNKFVSLSITEPTAVVAKHIENASSGTLNAFLKNLEEPQENLYYFLTTSSVYKVLPTIVSRCEVVRVRNINPIPEDEEIVKFIELPVGKKMIFIDKIRKRDEALTFLENLIDILHRKLIGGEENLNYISSFISFAERTFLNIQGNGNVTIQLTNLVVNTDNNTTFKH